jgi:hypothetical protein
MTRASPRVNEKEKRGNSKQIEMTDSSHFFIILTRMNSLGNTNFVVSGLPDLEYFTAPVIVKATPSVCSYS